MIRLLALLIGSFGCFGALALPVTATGVDYTGTFRATVTSTWGDADGLWSSGDEVSGTFSIVASNDPCISGYSFSYVIGAYVISSMNWLDSCSGQDQFLLEKEPDRAADELTFSPRGFYIARENYDVGHELGVSWLTFDVGESEVTPAGDGWIWQWNDLADGDITGGFDYLLEGLWDDFSLQSATNMPDAYGTSFAVYSMTITQGMVDVTVPESDSAVLMVMMSALLVLGSRRRG